jgi:hypothetical protein
MLVLTSSMALQLVVNVLLAPDKAVVSASQKILSYTEEITNTDGHPFNLLVR